MKELGLNFQTGNGGGVGRTEEHTVREALEEGVQVGHLLQVQPRIRSEGQDLGVRL